MTSVRWQRRSPDTSRRTCARILAWCSDFRRAARRSACIASSWRCTRRGNADFSLATTFNLDEFAGLDPSNPGSYRTFMAQHLFAHVNLAPERIHFLNGAAADLEAECVRYEGEIAAVGGIDLLILGIGTNGHIGFNEPASRADRADAQG